MGELRVPTVAFPAEAVCADGRTFVGRIFVPAAASRHAGAMRAEEWMNEGSSFFPLLPDDSATSVLLNKQELLVLSVSAAADRSEVMEEAEALVRRVALECGGRRLEGALVIDMPSTQSRVLDYLNRPEPFLTLREGDRHHLVRKSRITRVVELPEP
jgi:hypothetical protein